MPMTSCSQRFAVGKTAAAVAGDALCIVSCSARMRAVAGQPLFHRRRVVVNGLPVATGFGMLVPYDTRGGENR
jgi:hypothetical protein